MTTKKDIRKHFLEQRLNLDESAAARLNAALLEQVLRIDFSPYRYAHVFLPILEKKEADTWPVIDALKVRYPQLNWVLSRSDMQAGTMEHLLWTPATTLAQNKFGITEPQNGEAVDLSLIDVVFVPMLAFDTSGHRVGYGKGMYDRFLKQCRPDVQTIGLSLFEPIAAIPETDAFDVPLRIVVTPEKIYHFNNED
ncbi:5-formyltetrahydrofolate cyclo-ligase [Chitinophaga jiangningensis]|uniref:5-formyltetrahydrofolate cyclo-ligase n=1 Tax=Chitinophaga jiangningensis TaxID=1419482 RepID=A0A1M7MYK3_9BACT|nr:5-formyltetrahydrofolate cyclo-ligase [Chitinophaga jiangningensis]SHM96295.1 5-formyltetrahydrofolate cyclo-ligase [Chitinophaga jiangningensis]